MTIRLRYGPRRRVATVFSLPSLTKQSFAPECDINRILARFARDGVIEHLERHHGEYGNFLDVPDYQTALNQVEAARLSFLRLPSAVRSRFGNDPAAFLDFAQDPANLPAMREMGLAPAAPAEAADEPSAGDAAERRLAEPATPPAAS